MIGAAAGVWGAVRVPAYLRGRRWTELLEPPAAAAARRPPRGTARASRIAVRVLAAIPGLPWRNTCLYRSIAECLALRSAGVPAVVRIGVRPGREGEASVAAHAWVVDPRDERPPPDGLRPFVARS
jgi:hypothetical protein